jgi:hypothetical protein
MPHMAGTVPDGGGANTISVPWILIVFASMARARLTLVQIATVATASTASPSARSAVRASACLPLTADEQHSCYARYDSHRDGDE